MERRNLVVLRNKEKEPCSQQDSSWLDLISSLDFLTTKSITHDAKNTNETF